MHRFVKIIILACMLASIVAAGVYAGSIVGTASLTVATPSPTPTSVGPTPVALASPVIVMAKGQPLKHLDGSNVASGCTPAGNGSTDDSACIQTAVNAGDVLVLSTAQNCTGSGTFTSGSGSYAASGSNPCCTGPAAGSCSGMYYVNTFNGSDFNNAVTLGSNRNIRGGNGTIPPDPAVGFSYNHTTSQCTIMSINANSSIMGLSFRGPNYTTNPTAAPVYGGNNNQIFVTITGSSNGQRLIANDDFNGVGGEIAAVNVSYTASGTMIEYNTAENCGYYFVQGTQSGGTTVQYNKTYDCACCVESGGTAPDLFTINHEVAHWKYGSEYGHRAGPAPGTQELNAGTDSSGNNWNYAGNVLQNSCCDGTIQSYLDYYVRWTSTAGCPTFTNNSYGQSCSLATSAGGGVVCPGTSNNIGGTACTDPF